jgi:hypothetical protein
MPMLEGFQSMERLWDPVNSTSIDNDEGHTNFTQVHVPSVEDRYILLAI